jgi:hypothetical protein
MNTIVRGVRRDEPTKIDKAAGHAKDAVDKVAKAVKGGKTKAKSKKK